MIQPIKVLFLLLLPVNIVWTYQIKCNHGHKQYTLSCRFNYIDDNKTLEADLPADFAKFCDHITQVTLGISNLTTLPSDLFTLLPNLHTLTARADIQSITGEQFANASKLAVLDFGFNNRLTSLEANLFKFMPQLEYIDLGFNLIENIDDMAFDGLGRLKKLYLEANILTNLTNETFYGTDNLETLELSRNFIQDIEEFTFSRMTKLKQLFLSRNILSRLQTNIFTGLESIERIDLSINQIATIESGVFDWLPTLSVLELGFNRITTIPSFDGSTNLAALFLALNLLTDIDGAFPDLPNLKVLDLSYNPITLNDSSVFSSLPSLDSLELHGCNLTEIDNELFSYLSNLTVLDLSDNHLSELNLSIFNGLDKLRILKIEGNQIYELNDYADFKTWMPSLEYVTIARNEIDCDTIAEIIAYFKNNTITYELGEEVDVGCRLLPFQSRAIQAYRLSKAEILEKPNINETKSLTSNDIDSD